MARKLNSKNVIDALTNLFYEIRLSRFIRSDNGPEFNAQAISDWISVTGLTKAYIELVSPSENRYCGRFNGRPRVVLSNG